MPNTLLNKNRMTKLTFKTPSYGTIRQNMVLLL